MRGTMGEAVRAASHAMTAAGVPSPWPDAVSLAREALARTDGTLLEVTDHASEAFLALFNEWISRRLTREPLQHIIGYVEFCGIRLATAPGVFIPRPETELLAHDALTFAARLPAPVVVDLCTGSGAIACAVAAALPASRVWAVDVDPAAVALATRNARGLPVSVLEGDAATAFVDLAGEVDVVASNPPYIPPDAVPTDPEVLAWDPDRALYGGGSDGLEIPRAVAANAKRLLRPGGLFLMEHADLQGEAVRDLVRAVGGFTMVQTRRDLTGRDRYVIATREDS